MASLLLVFCFRFCPARRESHFRSEFKQQGGAAAGGKGRKACIEEERLPRRPLGRLAAPAFRRRFL